ncbi:DUF1330 domain-containing protein [Psychrosphaera sp. F3M07]|uniref:DUF1330 domain-containing protein n=1 Tax=Psychrosphaera sp. F3M07 TaxID=2841560 RepID=UPI001C0A05E6|nr:DUF1330 domain-containing protein [Psychrosphaera sp. F3M07]MBU2919574.1 DUF1330 domain-containing protein [Psychrosphaera sp. F3M07]
MSAYLIIQATVTDWPNFKRYTDVVPALIKEFGGEYVVMDGKPELLEGDEAPGSVVVSKWPSKEHANNFWNSEQYNQAIKLRAGTGTFHVMLVDSL